MSISPEGREASRDASPAVRGEVRWYRAASFAHGGRRLAASANGPAPEPAGPRPAKTLSPQPRWIQNPRGAIDAYLRTMREAA